MTKNAVEKDWAGLLTTAFGRVYSDVDNVPGTPDTTPGAFDFTDQTGVTQSSSRTSDSVTPEGYDTPTAITVADGTYSINGGAFTASAGTLNPGDSIRLRHTASASLNTATTTTVTVGGVSADFTSTTVTEVTANPGLEFSLMPLQLYQPHATGSAGMGVGSGLHSQNRIYSAYPGLRYEIDIIPVGGAQPPSLGTAVVTDGPGVCELYTAPDGVQLWQYVWASPDATDSVTIEYTDRNGNVVSSTWTITVGTAGFKFVDAAAGVNGTGTLASPFNAPGGSLANAKAGCASGDILYMRSGTYHPVLENTAGPFGAMFWHPNVTTVQFIAYPGETPVIDMGFNGTDYTVMLACNFTTTGAPTYFDGITFLDCKDKFVYVGLSTGDGVGREFGFRKCTFDGFGPGTSGGHNNACVTFPQDLFITPRSRGFFVANTFRNGDSTYSCGVKFYSVNHTACHGNYVEDVADGTEADTFFAFKSDCGFVSMVGNSNAATQLTPSFGGNMHYTTGRPEDTRGEVSFNNWQRTEATEKYVMILNQDGQMGELNIHNNTIRGRIGVITNNGAGSTNDGVANFQRNAIVNSHVAQSPWTYIEDLVLSGGSTISTLVTQTDELFDADLDADGNLQNFDLTDHGPGADPEDRRGHMV
jgi:hypothetical protein